jgi:hypothetical protein
MTRGPQRTVRTRPSSASMARSRSTFSAAEPDARSRTALFQYRG